MENLTKVQHNKKLKTVRGKDDGEENPIMNKPA